MKQEDLFTISLPAWKILQKKTGSPSCKLTASWLYIQAVHVATKAALVRRYVCQYLIIVILRAYNHKAGSDNYSQVLRESHWSTAARASVTPLPVYRPSYFVTAVFLYKNTISRGPFIPALLSFSLQLHPYFPIPSIHH